VLLHEEVAAVLREDPGVAPADAELGVLVGEVDVGVDARVGVEAAHQRAVAHDRELPAGDD